jgi:hypothetical protein
MQGMMNINDLASCRINAAPEAQRFFGGNDSADSRARKNAVPGRQFSHFSQFLE